jgi:hypothetical protein
MWQQHNSFPWLTGEWRWRTGRFARRPILQVLEARETAYLGKSKTTRYQWRDASFKDLSSPMLKGILSNPGITDKDVQRRRLIGAELGMA